MGRASPTNLVDPLSHAQLTPRSTPADTLFPYARNNVRTHLEAHYDSEEGQEDVAAIRQQVGGPERSTRKHLPEVWGCWGGVHLSAAVSPKGASPRAPAFACWPASPLIPAPHKPPRHVKLLCRGEHAPCHAERPVFLGSLQLQE